LARAHRHESQAAGDARRRWTWRLAFVGALLAPAPALLLAPSARAAISYATSSTAMTPPLGASSLTLPAPVGLAAGEVEIATISLAGQATISPPPGWAQVIDTEEGTALHQASFSHVAGPKEGGALFTFSAATTAAGGIAAYSGVDTSAIVDASAAQTGSGTTATIPSVSAGYAGDLVLGVGSFAAGATLTAGSGTTKRYSALASPASGPALLAQDATSAAAGPTAAQSIGSSLAAGWVGQAIALKAAGAAGTLSVSTSATPSFTADLNAGDQSPSYPLPLSVTATTSPPPGWNLTITSTQFSNATATLAANASQIASAPTVSCTGSSCTAPSNAISYPVTIPAGATPPAPVKFFDAAAGTGAGSFTITPAVTVFVPQNSYAGTYTSTLTISIASGP
jgi:hypothetical protein